MKHNLWLCQATFSERINKAQAATTASYKIREILPKTITFAGSNMLKVCSLVATDT
jgi:asparagine synthetase A